MSSCKPTVKISVKKAYGVERYYPENETAELLAEFGGCQTFTRAQLELLKKLGFAIEAVAPSIEGLTD